MDVAKEVDEEAGAVRDALVLLLDIGMIAPMCTG
jgi:hypothetical protein